MAQNTSPAQADAFAPAHAEKRPAWLLRNDKLRGWRRTTSGFFFDEGFAVGGFVSRDLGVKVSRKLCNSKRCKILLSPDQARDIRYDIFLEHAIGGQLCNEFAMQFLELSWIFAG